MNLRRTSYIIVGCALLGTPLLCHGQLFNASGTANGGGSWQDCDPSLQIDFQDSLVGYLTYRFDPEIVPGSNVILNTAWSYYDGSFEQAFEDTLTHEFPYPGEHFVCLTANAFDLIAEQTCVATTCRPVEVLQHASCEDLMVDFTIEGVDGQTITFMDLSYFPGGVASTSWSFGNGTSSIDLQPTQFFSDSGPHQVCLTVVTNGPVPCTATVCKWLYLGPAPVECDVLLDPGFLFLQQGELVGVLDTSTTTGSLNNVNWDFGDGHTASGTWAVHGYEQSGSYSLCGTVQLWGPLAADTCSSTLCIPVLVMETVGMEDADEDRTGLSAFPVPFHDRLVITGLGPEPLEIQLFDQAGHLVHSEKHRGNELMLRLGHLNSGVYVLRSDSGTSSRVVRIMKE